MDISQIVSLVLLGVVLALLGLFWVHKYRRLTPYGQENVREAIVVALKVVGAIGLGLIIFVLITGVLGAFSR